MLGFSGLTSRAHAAIFRTKTRAISCAGIGNVANLSTQSVVVVTPVVLSYYHGGQGVYRGRRQFAAIPRAYPFQCPVIGLELEGR